MSALPIIDLKKPTDPRNYVDREFAKGTPVNWRDDVIGELPAAVWAFLENKADAGQLQTVIYYVQYHIHAPCWLESCPWDVDEESAAEIRALRMLSMQMKTVQDLRAYIHRALNMAIDPL